MRLLRLILVLLIFSSSAVAQQRQETEPVSSRLVRFYPNPASTFIQFEFASPMTGGSQLVVFNFLGKKVMELAISMSKARVDLTSFGRGIYIYQLKDKTGKVIVSGKFQVEK